MRVNELKTLLEKMIPARLTVLITGAPGIGKTDVCREVTRKLGYDYFPDYPGIKDPTDFGGLPFVTNDHVEYKTFGVLYQVLTSTRNCVYFLDELGQGTPAVQAACMPWLLAREAHGHRLPNHVSIIAATNRRTDRAGVTGLLEPVKSRFAAIVELEPHIDDWCAWAYAHEVPASLIAFLRFRSELLCKFEATNDLRNSPLPRTWAAVARIQALNLPLSVRRQAFAGAVGEGAAIEYIAFEKLSASLVTADEIIRNPTSVPLPGTSSECYATCVALAAKMNQKVAGPVSVFLQRLLDAKRGDFVVLTLRDTFTRDRSLAQTVGFQKLLSGPLGKLIVGVE